MRRGWLTALVLAAACAKTPPRPPAIAAVEIRLLPGVGRAWVRIDSSGAAKGGHFSGEAPAVQVHVDTATIAADSVRVLFAAVRGLGDSLLARRGPATDTSRTGTATLAITFSDGTQAQIVWDVTTEPDDERIRTLLEHLMANRIGGW